MEEWITNPTVGAAVVIVIGVIIMVSWVSALGRRLKRLRKQYIEVMGSFGSSNVEEVILGLKETVRAQQETIKGLEEKVERLQIGQKRTKGKVGLFRYNAFSERGNDLSFSIAVLNEEEDGFVISGIYNRDNTYVYAKPVEKGESAYPLTPEERKAIVEAK